MRTLYVFEAKQPGWENWIPMTHIEPLTSPFDAEKKLTRLIKTHSFAAWRIRRYQRVEEDL